MSYVDTDSFIYIWIGVEIFVLQNNFQLLYIDTDLLWHLLCTWHIYIYIYMHVYYLHYLLPCQIL